MNDNNKFTVYVTKYALTQGILKVEVEACDDDPRTSAMVCYKGWGMNTYFHGEGRDWHRTFDQAVKRARKMQEAKLKSLDKQRALIAGLDFTRCSED